MSHSSQKINKYKKLINNPIETNHYLLIPLIKKITDISEKLCHKENIADKDKIILILLSRVSQKLGIFDNTELESKTENKSDELFSEKSNSSDDELFSSFLNKSSLNLEKIKYVEYLEFIDNECKFEFLIEKDESVSTNDSDNDSDESDNSNASDSDSNSDSDSDSDSNASDNGYSKSFGKDDNDETSCSDQELINSNDLSKNIKYINIMKEQLKILIKEEKNKILNDVDIKKIIDTYLKNISKNNVELSQIKFSNDEIFNLKVNLLNWYKLNSPNPISTDL